MEIPLITIEVTPDIALKIRGMAEAGVFSIIKGNVSLNFDGGQLKSIKTELYTYPHPTDLTSGQTFPILK